MNLLFPLYILFVGGLGVVFFITSRRREKHFEGQKKELSRKLYEVSVLNNLQKNISHTLDIKKITVDTLVNGLENFIVYSTMSHLLIEEDKLILKNYIKEPVNKFFLEKVKQNLLDSVYELDPSTRNYVVSEYTSGILSTSDMSQPMSYFNIPLYVNNKLICIINIASKIRGIYGKSEMSFLYEIATQAEKSIERLERVIETEKGKLNSMLSSLPNGALMFLFDEGSFKVSFINDSAKDFLKIIGEPSTAEIIGSFGAAIDVIKEIKSVLREKKDVVHGDIVVNEKYFKIVFSPVFLYGTDKIIGVSVTMQDMSLEKQIQSMRENFTNMLVHELRAPLISIRGGSELLMKGVLQKEDTDKMLRLMLDSSKRMLDQVGEILDAAKIEAGKFTIIKDMAKFDDLAKEKVQTFSYVAQNKQVNIRINVPDNIPQFEFDKERVGQVLNNLISNAIKFTEAEGIIEVGADVSGQELKVWVKDNGKGIPIDRQSGLFSMYTQATTTGMRQAGTGLGLYIAKSIVESHNGKIWFESSEGQGTTFFFTLPIITSKAEEGKEVVVKPVPVATASKAVN